MLERSPLQSSSDVNDNLVRMKSTGKSYLAIVVGYEDNTSAQVTIERQIDLRIFPTLLARLPFLLLGSLRTHLLDSPLSFLDN